MIGFKQIEFFDHTGFSTFEYFDHTGIEVTRIPERKLPR
jgi:hypothetical protein